MRARSRFAAALLSIAAGAGLLAAPALVAVPAGAANHTVDLGAMTFSPSSLTIQVGDTVTWVHDGSSIPHSVTADDGSFDSSPGCPPTCLGAGATFHHTFNQAGTFPYHCRIHGAAGGIGMAGTITVVSAPSTTTPTTAPTTAAPGGSSPPTVATGSAGSGTGSGGSPATRTGSTTTSLAFTGSSDWLLAALGAACLALGTATLWNRRVRPSR